ncbi:MAG: response regulator transcription factor [Lachnospiraceae bacterium]|nr:response regulator transcription factor [Lachnospiraceae bacterium]
MAEILIVEDELSINELIRKNLSLTGHRCTQAFDGKTAVSLLENRNFDLLVLDIMLPGLDGYQVFERASGTPTIFLTAKSELADKLKGLAMGADDYLTKPFQMLELAARVEAVLRRTKKGETEFEMGDLKVDFGRHQAFLKGTAVECTPKEYELLEVLVRNRNIALSREKLLDMVWGYDFDGGTRTVDVHIQRLRQKLHLENDIRTVYKLGYRLEVRE